MLDTSALPAELASAAATAWERILEALPVSEHGNFAALLESPGIAQQCARVLACSRFAAETLRRRPWLLPQLLTAGALQHPLRAGEMERELDDWLARGDSDFAVVLRRFRQRQQLRIIWRDLNRLAATQETTRDVSWLAEASISRALTHCTAPLTARFGTPIGRYSGAPQALVVIAMGKLGAQELNLSSDIDLIFAYPEAGTTTGGPRSLSNEEYFTRLGRALIAALDAVTAEGFVFRVDMRLRPYGESGALVHSFAALESYYQEQGRDWERYALIKARPLTGGEDNGRRLMALLQPFVYRRYLDFSAIDSLRAMKRLIVAELRRGGLEGNVKLGAGGIREIEFIAQCFQLIRGGRDADLRQRELLPVLAECARLGCLPATVSAALSSAYCFLRDTEHAIQAWEDRQTQELPGDPLARQALAHCMGFAGYDAFLLALDSHRRNVQQHFGELIDMPQEIGDDELDATTLWGPNSTAEALRDCGFSDPEVVLGLLSELHDSRRVRQLQSEGRVRLDRFMPLLLRACGEVEDSDLALQRVLPLVVAVLRRSAYLLLLIENPPALADLVSLCAASPWIADALVARPALLDELLDRASLYTAPDREGLQDDLRQQLMRLSRDDLEGYMEALRYFKASQVLRVAASELAGRLPLMQVSDKLSFIAEVCLQEVLELAWAQMCTRYGEPVREGSDSGFAIVAYGKLGGIELSYGSDLDLVFIFDADTRGCTRGARSIENSVFYTRLGQRIIHILESRTALGQLYEIDMRLRPSGNSGLLVSSIGAFERYQREDAWTWEHQALVRTRCVAGDPLLEGKIEELRRALLCQQRDSGLLARDVVAMREKMRRHAGVTAQDAELDLKQGCGAIVDIEFMVQYAVLAWASEAPALARWSDNVRILATLAEIGRLPRELCARLTQAYLDLRSATHQLALQQHARRVPAAQFADASAAVCEAWQGLFGCAPGSDPHTETDP
jgi:glutamate-ammonia-ligase adenylyltransferase